MKPKKICLYPLNRVEGDIEIRIAVEDQMAADAWSAGIKYRGFENLLAGRAVLDGLVLTPRICGICSTSHLKAAAKALDMFYKVKLPNNAVRIRNIALIAEKVQNDVRHSFLLFMVDFTNRAYRRSALYDEAFLRYQPMAGESTLQTIAETKKMLEIIAILGGQWPHSSFMVPGGVVCVPSQNDLIQCLFLLRNFRNWYEHRVLGCRIERWLAVASASDLEDWLHETDAHARSDLGFYIRFSKAADLKALGSGCGNFISFGSLDLPEDTSVKSFKADGRMFPSGFYHNGELRPFNPDEIAEDVSHAWFEDSDSGRHPYAGKTRPYATGGEGGKYSWAKAPRYEGLPAETGPLAELIVAGDRLIKDLVEKDGPNVFVRQLARLTRAAHLIPAMEQWLEETVHCSEDFYLDYRKRQDGKGCGLLDAPRGALGHWLKVKDARIDRYQIITPTTWNASPRDANGASGPCEQAIVGTQIKDLDNPVEVDHIIRSFDPCLVCTVHAIQGES